MFVFSQEQGQASNGICGNECRSREDRPRNRRYRRRNADDNRKQGKSEPSRDVATEAVFEPYKPKIRKSGTGCVTMINDHLYEGRFTPRVNGKRISKNVYAKTREEKLGFYSCTVPTFMQYVLTELIDNGDFERHINRVRRGLRKQNK